jgi:hypothetical protein
LISAHSLLNTVENVSCGVIHVWWLSG